MKKHFSADHKRRAVEAFDQARQSGATIVEAERLCGHPSESIKLWRAKLSEAPAKQRPCLCCRQPFRSTGPGHRLCRTCKHQDSGLPAGWDHAL